MVNAMKKVTIKIDMDSEELWLLEGRKKVGNLTFMLDFGEDKILSTTLAIKEGFRRKGYGTLLMRALMGIADFLQKPIFVISEVDTIDFYKRLGFVCLRKFKNGSYKGKEVMIGNLREKRPSNFLKAVEETDLIYIPSKVEKVEIYI